MKQTNAQKIRLGIFVIIGTLLFVVGIYLIGQQQNMFKKNYTISAYFQNVNGLQKGNNVRYSGINIGTVKSVSMLNDSTIIVEMNIDEKITSHIKKNAVAIIGSDGLVGNMIINIQPGHGIAPSVEDGDIIASFSKIGPDDIMSTLSVTIKNAEKLTEDLLKITNAINQGQGTLTLLLNDTILASDIKSTFNNLKMASRSASNTINELNSLVKTVKTDDQSVLGTLLNDTVSANKLKLSLSNLEASSLEVVAVLKNINTIVNDVNNSEGAYNYLVKDTSMVNSLKSTLKNVDEGTDKFNQNMEALKHNFLTRGYFRKLERQERKANDTTK